MITVEADVRESRYLPFVKSRHCRYLGKRHVMLSYRLVSPENTRWKVKLSTTRDTTTSEWSRLFLSECFIASSRLREDIG